MVFQLPAAKGFSGGKMAERVLDRHIFRLNSLLPTISIISSLLIAFLTILAPEVPLSAGCNLYLWSEAGCRRRRRIVFPSQLQMPYRDTGHSERSARRCTYHQSATLSQCIACVIINTPTMVSCTWRNRSTHMKLLSQSRFVCWFLGCYSTFMNIKTNESGSVVHGDRNNAH